MLNLFVSFGCVIIVLHSVFVCSTVFHHSDMIDMPIMFRIPVSVSVSVSVSLSLSFLVGAIVFLCIWFSCVCIFEMGI